MSGHADALLMLFLAFKAVFGRDAEVHTPGDSI